VDIQIIAHGVDTAELGADLLGTELPGDPVVDEALAQTNNLDIRGPCLPYLPFGQGPLPLRLYLHFLLQTHKHMTLFNLAGALHLAA
jgi:hypothetical protein